MKFKAILLLLSLMSISACSGINNNNGSNNGNDSGNNSGGNNNNNSGGQSGTNDNGSGNNSDGSGSNTDGDGSSDNGDNNDNSDGNIDNTPRRMQDTPILHAWNWSMNNVKNNLDNIKDAGYKAIQLSPLQPQKDYYGGQASIQNEWWKLYQPLGLCVAQSNQNAMGNADNLRDLCSVAKAKGIDIIMDVVTNHLANNGDGDQQYVLNGGVNTYESTIYGNTGKYLHTLHSSSDDNDVQRLTQGTIGMPDLNTEDSYVQGRVISMLKSYIDLGVSGFRFDAAKHIATPDDGTYKSDYWPNVLNATTTYAQSKGVTPYYYGEILNTVGTGRSLSSYTKYMSVCDSNTSTTVLNAVKDNNLSKLVKEYESEVDSEKLVIWAESHDNYASYGRPTASRSSTELNKAYAIQASRKGASSLYLARPNSFDNGNTTSFGQVGETHYKDSEVKAANRFHNYMVGQSENIVNNNNCFVNVRGKVGALIVNLNSSATTIDVTGLADGTYTELATNKSITVTNGKVTPTFTNGVCALVNPSYITTDNNNNNQGGGSTTPTDDLSDCDVIIQNADTSYKYGVWAWKEGTSNSSEWLTVKQNGSSYGFKMTNKDRFIFVKFPSDKATNVWENKIAQTDDMTYSSKITYSYSNLTWK